jgi:hypothetical protein
MNRFRIAAAALVLAVGAGLSCEREPAGPQGGPLRVVLTSPGGNVDGAISFSVTGGVAPTGATAGAGLREFHQAFATTTRFVVTGSFGTNTTLVTIQVSDRSLAFTGGVVQVAATNNQLRASTAGYTLSVMP